MRAVAHYRPIVGNSQQTRGPIACDGKTRAFQLEFGVQRNDKYLSGAHNLPRIGVAQPVVRLLELPAVVDRLPKHPIFVAQAVTDRRILQSSQRVDEAGGKTP